MDVECFIYHKTLTDNRLAELSRNLHRVLNPSNISPEQMHAAVKQTHHMQLNETLNRLAKNLPVYNVKIDMEGMATVTPA